jgi:hypothetical protein
VSRSQTTFFTAVLQVINCRYANPPPPETSTILPVMRGFALSEQTRDFEKGTDGKNWALFSPVPYRVVQFRKRHASRSRADRLPTKHPISLPRQQFLATYLRARLRSNEAMGRGMISSDICLKFCGREIRDERSGAA